MVSYWQVVAVVVVALIVSALRGKQDNLETGVFRWARLSLMFIVILGVSILGILTVLAFQAMSVSVEHGYAVLSLFPIVIGAILGAGTLVFGILGFFIMLDPPEDIAMLSLIFFPR